MGVLNNAMQHSGEGDFIFLTRSYNFLKGVPSVPCGIPAEKRIEKSHGPKNKTFIAGVSNFTVAGIKPS